MIFLRMSLHCKLVQYREYENVPFLLQLIFLQEFLLIFIRMVRTSEINNFWNFWNLSLDIPLWWKAPSYSTFGELPAPYRTTEGVSNHFMARIGIFLLYEGSVSVQVSQLSRRKTKICVMDWGMIYWSDFGGKFSAVASLRSQCFRADPSLWRRDNTQNISFTN